MGDSHERRVLRRAAEPIAKRIGELQAAAEGSWERLVDHPKLSLAIAFIAIAVTLSGKVSAVAVWISLAVAWPLLTAWMAGLSWIRAARRSRLWVGSSALVFGVVLSWMGYFLRPGGPPESELLNAVRAMPDAVYSRMAALLKQHTHEVASETASEVTKLLIPPSISFTAQRKLVFRHGLNTRAPHIECFGINGEDLRTWEGPKVVDANTVSYDVMRHDFPQ